MTPIVPDAVRPSAAVCHRASATREIALRESCKAPVVVVVVVVIMNNYYDYYYYLLLPPPPLAISVHALISNVNTRCGHRCLL